jgi:DNA-binding Lrp family transcriptional regulator
MKKLFALCCCLLLTSCFEITERIKHHDDQSGEYTLMVDFSKSWLKTKSAIWLEEVDGVKIPNEQEITQKLNDFKTKASKIEGISNVSTKTDFDKYIFIIKLDYKNMKALNEVVNTLNKQKSQTHFSSNTKSFERVASYPIPENLLKDDKKKEDLEKASIIAIYTFDRDISTTTNPNSKISKNKKTVFLKQSMYNVLKKSSLMNNEIQLTN